MSNDVRVRFAPSPTGHLHIGGVRTALFNWFYARNQGGKFILRIEDTDRTRSEEKYEREIQESLAWLGLDWDDPVVRQSDDLVKYQKAAQQLVEKGLAQPVEQGSAALVFKVDPACTVVFTDLVHGDISVKGQDIGDIIIMKSDGFPTYNFACVVDDAMQGITHVIRGDDHISNTPKQILMYKALGFRTPKFAHIPLIMGPDGSPLSKRHGAVSLKAYSEEGYCKEGIINYLSLLGWGAAGGAEQFTVEQIVKQFSIKRINTTNAIFDNAKFKAINGWHLKEMTDERFVAEAFAFADAQARVPAAVDRTMLAKVMRLYKGRARTFSELFSMLGYVVNTVTFDAEAVAKHLSSDAARSQLLVLRDRLATVAFDEHVALEAFVRGVAQELQVKAGDLIHPLRVALTGGTVSPGIFELMCSLGKTFVLERLTFVIDHWNNLN